MKNSSKLLSILLAIMTMVSIIPISSITVSAAVSGTCGDDLTWIFNESTGTLTISGTGDMHGYYYDKPTWFDYEDSIKKVVVDDGVTSIGDYAFYSCENLASVSLGNNIRIIGDYAFHYCTSLKNITIPNSVEKIENNAFDFCTSITSISLPDSVMFLGEYAFYFCEKLSTLTIGSGLSDIGNYAFFGCKNLTNISVDEQNKYYSNDEHGVLFNKNKTTLIQYPVGKTITSYTIPYGVNIIDKRAFAFCSNLINVTIPNGVLKIREEAFFECSRLTELIIPDSVTTIEKYAFNDCNSLIKIKIGNGVRVLSYAMLSSCDNLESVVLPTSVTLIEQYAFSDCFNLTDVYYTGTEKQWNEITIDWYNDCLLNATIHFNYIEHVHSFGTWTTIMFPSCTTMGKQSRSCSCGENEYKSISATGHSFVDGVCKTCGTKDQNHIDNFNFNIQNPSRTTISYKDGIILHANVDGTLPAGVKIVWSASNNKFKTTNSANGSTLTIVSNSNGYTTFTATLIDANGNELAIETIEMRSKAGFFDKIGGFFRGLFGLTKIYDK